jgi:hypothetical protein
MADQGVLMALPNLLLLQGTNHEMPMSREAETAIQNKWVEMRQHAQSA